MLLLEGRWCTGFRLPFGQNPGVVSPAHAGPSLLSILDFCLAALAR